MSTTSTIEEYNEEYLDYIASVLAADLSDEQIDINEAIKASEYLNSLRDRDYTIAIFFEWLNEVTRSRALIRSKQTKDYYERLKKVCERRLSEFDHIKPAAQSMAQAVRMARFYNANRKTLAEEDPRRAPTPPRIAVETKISDNPSLSKAAVSTSPTPAGPPIQENAILKAVVASFEGRNVVLGNDLQTQHYNKPVKWLIRRREAENYRLSEGQPLEVRVIKLDESEDKWLIGCEIVSGAQVAQPQVNQVAQSKKNTLEEMLEKMKREAQNKNK